MNIVLIGMSGAGKSTIGVLLAKALGMEYVDTDILIQKIDGRLLQVIIDSDGIDNFLKVEESVIANIKFNNCIIATGGSVIYSDRSMRILRESGKVLYLHVPYEEIEKRLMNITTRGIVMREGYSQKDVYQERLPLYIKYSDITIDCLNKDVEQCVNEIYGLFKRFNNSSTP